MIKRLIPISAAVAWMFWGWAGVAYGQSYTGVTISAAANIYGAGFDDAPAPGGGTGGLPPIVAAITIPDPVKLTFSSVTGLVRCSVSDPLNGPDGGTGAGGVTNMESFRDVSGLIHSNRTMFLVGVFRDSNAGSPGGTPPVRLGFSDPENFLTLSPLLNQMFFIGDGRTDDTNAVQTFFVPAGATRLYLGFADGFSFTGFPGHYGDNTGELVADFEFTPVPEPAVSLTAAGIFLGGWVLHRRRNAKTSPPQA